MWYLWWVEMAVGLLFLEVRRLFHLSVIPTVIHAYSFACHKKYAISEIFRVIKYTYKYFSLKSNSSATNKKTLQSLLTQKFFTVIC